jgi:hypothetical protein
MGIERDAIGIRGIDMEGEKEPLSKSSTLSDVRRVSEDDIATLVDVGFAEYRRKNDMRTVKKNGTIPLWLSLEAEKAGANFSAILQTALKRELHVTERN